MAYNLRIVSKSPNPPPPPEQETQELFKLLDEFCSNGELQNLVRTYRPSEKDFPSSGRREELMSSVRRLFGSGHLRREKLDAVLERAEENGRQHILLYVPADDGVAAKLNDFEKVEAGLLDGRTRESAGLPRFQIRPMDVQVADLRLETRKGTKYTAWTYKLYAGAEKWEQLGKPVIEDDVKTVKMKRRYIREVIVVKWHSFGLLELRVPTGGGRSQLQAVRNGLLGTLTASLGLQNSQDGDGSAAKYFADLSTEFSAERSKPTELSEHPAKFRGLVPFRIPTTRLNDLARAKTYPWLSTNLTGIDVDGHWLTVGSRDEGENIYDSPIVADALKKARDCTQLGVVIHLHNQPDFPERLGVEFCPNFPNEVRIASRTTPEAVEFVIRRVWEFAGRAPLPDSPVDAATASQPTKSALSTLDFDGLTRHYPSLANAILRVQQWIESHPTAEYLDPKRLQKALGTGLKAIDIAVVVGQLVQRGILTQRYRVKPANRRKYLAQVFESVDDLLDGEIKDDQGEVVDLQDADIVSVYGKASG